MRRKALIVEDDEITRALLRRLVESEQCCDIDETRDGETAIELLDANDYDVILLDIVLPRISGATVMEHLFVTNPAALQNVIVVTGLNVEEIRKLFPTVCQALSKPVMPKRLMDSIHKCLRVSADEYLTAQ